jgi:hypothetical protein
MNNTYKDVLGGNPLLLFYVWNDKDTYPEIPVLNKVKPSTGKWYPESCVGVDLNRSPNKGGGWRPNLNCIEGYELGEFSQVADDLTESFSNILYDVNIVGDDLEREINNLFPNMSQADSTILMQVVDDYRNDPTFGIE